ncbi:MULTISPECIES: septum site-determining protein MinC [Priestia]|uniref:septum site-determining protein MinC n=1 Tax=Priestia TaxID=2800373 RepID=UPI0005ED2471|nr:MULTISPECIES: septum site-determining protein MinC [Priestia]KJL05648.1 septum formation inhibitor [Priestia aryabhattai B8W22]MBX4161338.1 septum site-determining protein MinC [Priestia megaterium]MED3894099.1 septum site-determining protein MinC [Priestia aryabhattai]
MNKQKQQNVTIKGTKDGLTLHLNDRCSFAELLTELKTKLLTNKHGDADQIVTVYVKIGNRYLTTEQETELKALIEENQYLVVKQIDSNVILKQDAVRVREESELVSVTKVVRSGQVLHVEGDLLLVGDVNPGGTVVAGGNLFVLGALKGIAHAGYRGNKNAVIAASLMKPSQLRIADIITRSEEERSEKEENIMECAYLDDNDQMVIDRVQALPHLRPNLTRVERRI